MSRPAAVVFACGLALAVVLTVAAEAHSRPPATAVIRAEFGTGPLAGCFTAIAWRESRYDPSAANWTDRHADGSRGSFGLFGIGALWRRPGETVDGFARRMRDPATNARLAHRLYRRYGLAPWGNRC